MNVITFRLLSGVSAVALMAAVALGTVQSGIDRTTCLVESLAPCPIIERGVEPDPPPQPAGTVPVPSGFLTVNSSTGTIGISNGISYLNGTATV